MRLLSKLLCGVMGAALLWAGDFPAAAAASGGNPAPRSTVVDVRTTVPTLPGTDAEAREYGQREAASPEVQEFAGGDVVIGVSVGLVVLVLLVVLVIYLLEEDHVVHVE